MLCLFSRAPRRRARIVRLALLVSLCSVVFVMGAPSAAGAAGTAPDGDSRAGASAYAVKQLQPVVYTAIDGHQETLTPWQGRYVSVLVEPGVTRQASVMTNLVTALDRAWSYYATTA